jgi:hypothetical protein
MPARNHPSSRNWAPDQIRQEINMSKEDTQHTIGAIHQVRFERDAIHIAVMPVMAWETLKPGQHVGFCEGGYHVTATPSEPYKLIGIVDPFLPKDVEKGERFWMVLYPNTITGLKHVWSHPAISQDGRGVGSYSEKWLRDFATDVDADYHEMMRVAASHCEDSKNRWGDYLSEGGKWEGQSTPDEFWTHFQNVTGKKPKDDDKPGIFSCSC